LFRTTGTFTQSIFEERGCLWLFHERYCQTFSERSPMPIEKSTELNRVNRNELAIELTSSHHNLPCRTQFIQLPLVGFAIFTPDPGVVASNPFALTKRTQFASHHRYCCVATCMPTMARLPATTATSAMRTL
jgi:hypothetical protein